jgi:hypothetical protein
MASCSLQGVVSGAAADDSRGRPSAAAAAAAAAATVAAEGHIGTGGEGQPGSGTATAAPPGWSAWELKPYMNDNRNWQVRGRGRDTLSLRSRVVFGSGLQLAV